METDKPRVLIVDDSRGDIRIVNENLKDHYTTQAATSGEQAIQVASQSPAPDLILMDVEMPGLNGYETCKQLKANPATQDIDVIFVSAHDTVEEIVAGYDAGGTDYLTKPIEPLELKRKISVAVNNRRLNKEFSSQKLDAEKVAMTALCSAGEQGVIIEFLRQCFVANSLPTLASLIVNTLESFELVSAIQIRSLSGIIDHAPNNAIVPLEQELLLRLSDKDQVIEKGQRAIFSRGDVSILIKNIPADKEKWGRLRDHITLLLEASNERSTNIMSEENKKSLVASANKALDTINSMQTDHKKNSQHILDNMLVKIEASFSSLHLTDSQEEALITMFQEGVNDFLAHMEKGFQIDEAVKKIINQLTNIQ